MGIIDTRLASTDYKGLNTIAKIPLNSIAGTEPLKREYNSHLERFCHVNSN